MIQQVWHDFLVFNGLLVGVVYLACLISYCMRLWFAWPIREEKSTPTRITIPIKVDKVNNKNPIYSNMRQ